MTTCPSCGHEFSLKRAAYLAKKQPMSKLEYKCLKIMQEAKGPVSRTYVHTHAQICFENVTKAMTNLKHMGLIELEPVHRSVSRYWQLTERGMAYAPTD